MGIELELSRAHANCDYLNTFTSTRNAKYSGYVVSKVFVPAEGGYFFVENEIIQQIIFTATITRIYRITHSQKNIFFLQRSRIPSF